MRLCVFSGPLRLAAALCATALTSAILTGCGASEPSSPKWLAPAEQGKKNVSSGTELERFFPLVDGMVYQYATENEMGEPGLLVARVFRTDERSGELRFPSGSKRFSYAPDGIVFQSVDGPVYLLKLPLTAGSTFRGEHGGQAKVLDVNVVIDTPAGHYTGCVRVLEERLGDRPVRYATTYCPEVGVVQLEAATGASFERASLKSYGQAFEIPGGDGLDRFQVAPPKDAAPAPGPLPR
ncbi:MAG: hypothetical protein U0359_33085 [Byssovorax sp.]